MGLLGGNWLGSYFFDVTVTANAFNGYAEGSASIFARLDGLTDYYPKAQGTAHGFARAAGTASIEES